MSFRTARSADPESRRIEKDSGFAAAAAPRNDEMQRLFQASCAGIAVRRTALFCSAYDPHIHRVKTHGWRYFVMAGLDPAIHALLNDSKDVDARVKPAHDVLL